MIVLASASPRRSELLRRCGLSFRVQPARDLEERLSGTAVEAATGLARKKAESVLRALEGKGSAGPGLVVLAADTVVEIGGSLLGKPLDREEARAMLEKLSGREHRVVTGLAIARPGRHPRVASETSQVTFRQLGEDDLGSYLASGDWEGKAGAYGIQSGGGTLVQGFRGCYYNVVGLPLVRLLSMLEREGAYRSPLATVCACQLHPLWQGGLGCGS